MIPPSEINDLVNDAMSFYKKSGKKKRTFIKIEKKRIRKFVSDNPEIGFALLLIFEIWLALYFWEEPQGFIHDHFPALWLDIAIFGILIVIFNKIAEQRRDIKRWLEEIDDCRGWDSDEAAHRIRGNLFRLNKRGRTSIDLSYCYLKKTDFIAFNRGERRPTLLDLSGSYFSHANLAGSSFMLANLQNTDFEGANLNGVDATYSDFRGARNLTVEQISSMSSLHFSLFNQNMQEVIIEVFPALLEKPKWWQSSGVHTPDDPRKQFIEDMPGEQKTAERR